MAEREIFTPGTTPGAEPDAGAAPPQGALNNAAPDDANAQRVVALEMQVAQMAAMMKQLLESGRAVADPVEVSKPARLVGEDVRPMTSAQLLEAVKAGKMHRPDRAVMCADGYLAPTNIAAVG